MQIEIMCNGQLFNPCRGMTLAEAHAAFAMYAGPRPAQTYTWELRVDGRVEKVVASAKGKAS